MSTPARLSGHWRDGGLKVDERQQKITSGEDEDLARRYEELRARVLHGGLSHAGLGAGLLCGQGMVAWMRGWRACQAPPSKPPVPVRRDGPGEVVDVLAAMAMACVGGGLNRATSTKR